MINDDDYYKILGIGYGASSAEIKNAFRNLTKLYHPDKHSNSKQSHNKYMKIVDAFNVLSNSAKREDYDKGLQLSIIQDHLICILVMRPQIIRGMKRQDIVTIKKLDILKR
ncbi:J domain-containing protein [Candidatus Nitrosocosmicus sp. R]